MRNVVEYVSFKIHSGGMVHHRCRRYGCAECAANSSYIVAARYTGAAAMAVLNVQRAVLFESCLFFAGEVKHLERKESKN